LNLNISAFRQNIKNLVGNFWAIYVRNMHANFQVSGSIGVGREWGDMQHDVKPFLAWSLYKNSKLPLALLGRDNLNCFKTFTIFPSLQHNLALKVMKFVSPIFVLLSKIILSVIVLDSHSDSFNRKQTGTLIKRSWINIHLCNLQTHCVFMTPIKPWARRKGVTATRQNDEAIFKA